MGSRPGTLGVLEGLGFRAVQGLGTMLEDVGAYRTGL